MSEKFALSLDGPIVQALLDLLPGTLHVKDRDYRYCVVNRNYLERWGAKAEDVVGRTSEEAFGNLFGGGADARNKEVFASGRALPFYEVAYRDKRGDRVVLWSTKVPIFGGPGTVTHVLTFSLDVTPLKRMQQQLDESEQLRSAIVDHSLECFITAGEDGRIVEFNPAAEQVFGYPRAEALGRPIGEMLELARPQSTSGTGAAVQRSGGLLELAGQCFETQGYRADGKALPVEVSLVEIPLREKRLFTACVRELSERQRAQAELERQRQALYQSERLTVLGTLAAGISHELRNPLSVVVSQAKLLEGEVSGERLHARVGAIVRAAERCAAIVSAFLDQSRSGPRKVEQFPVARVIDSALDLTAHLLREQEVSLRIEHAQPDLSVEGDPHQLSQVVLNLLLNAAAAMQDSARPKQLVIRTRLCIPEDMVELTVGDSGPGIAPDLRERVFERFFTTKAVGAGTGLGLPISRDIVLAHGGHIEVDQSPQGGALFRVVLPACRVPRVAEPSVRSVGSAPRYRILVVDDEAEVAELLREILEIAGHEIDLADCGETALQQLTARSYDLVLSDMRMPGMGGTMFYEALRRDHPELAGRFAFVTGDTVSPDASGFLRITGVPHLCKPFEPRQVTELALRLGRGEFSGQSQTAGPTGERGP